MRPVEFYITPRILLNFIKNLKFLKFSDITRQDKRWFYKIFWQLLCIFIKADLMSRNPKAIITSIDNCPKFGWLSENFHQAPCIAIQNGFRLSYDSDFEDNYYCQHLFCFGKREIIDFQRLNYKVDNFYPVGSLNLSLYLDNQLSDIDPVYDLLVVSCWRGNIGYSKDVEDSMKAMRIMDEALARYLGDRNLKAAVILRSERDSDQWVMPEIGMSEEDYYKSIYGDLIEIIDVNFTERNIYPVMMSAKAIIAGFGTTCLLEAFAKGKKVLYANFCETTKYHIDFKPEILFDGTEGEYECFRLRLDKLIDTSLDEYFSEHQHLINYYINIPATGTTHGIIEAKIKEIVGLA